MKFLNKKQKNNKGFSLVELIVVIAIMVVLVAVLAPVFTRYIESSRCSTDVQNANSISEAILAEVAEKGVAATATAGVVANTATEVNTDNIANIASLSSAPEVKGKKAPDGKHFFYKYDSGKNLCYVYVNDSVDETDAHNLTTDDGAATYKNPDTTITW